MVKARRILLVEDEIILAMQMKSELQRAGFCVLDFVSTGEEAVACALKEKPDLILMDINLAGKIDGIEAATSIKAEYSAAVIYLSGYADSRMRDRAEVTKPVKTSNLTALIKTWIES
jgi:CheY-like chemotaxis protein